MASKHLPVVQETEQFDSSRPQNHRLRRCGEAGKNTKMNFVRFLAQTRSSRLLSVSVAAAILVGCKREGIQVYRVPKEKAAPSAVAKRSGPSRARPQVSWKLPSGWREIGPGQMSLASFAIAGSGGAEAQVTITPLTRLGGRDAEIVNMWREQVGLAPLSREEATQQFQTVEVGGEPGKLFEIAGTPKDSSEPMRIVTAVVHRADASWFYKLAGDTTLVAAQKPVFIDFLKTITITEVEESPGAGGAATATNTKPNWTVPSGWKELPGTQFLVAKFLIPGTGEAKAEVNISSSPGTGGGLLPNVNRWRSQLGLPPHDASQPLAQISVDGGRGNLVEFSGTDVKTGNRARLIAAVVPQPQQTWFYKLMGDEQLVERERQAFTNFVQTAKYSNAP